MQRAFIAFTVRLFRGVFADPYLLLLPCFPCNVAMPVTTGRAPAPGMTGRMLETTRTERASTPNRVNGVKTAATTTLTGLVLLAPCLVAGGQAGGGVDGRDGTRNRRPHREAPPQALRRLDDLRVRPTRHDEREREGETGIVRVGVSRYCCINAFSVETSARQDLLACLGTSGLVLRLLYYSICCSVPRAFDSVFSTCQVLGGDRRGMPVCVVRDCECPVLVPCLRA